MPLSSFVEDRFERSKYGKKLTTNLVILGNSGAGKDTVAKYLRENYGAEKFSFAEEPKRALAEALGYSYELIEDRSFREATIVPGTNRTILEFLVEAYHVFRLMAPYYWPNRSMWRLELCESPWVITDLRSKAEYDLLTKYVKERQQKLAVIYVGRPDCRGLTSDCMVDWLADNFREDGFKVYHLLNDGTLQELHDKTEGLIAAIEAEQEP